MSATALFLNTFAVETWDTWFRWRERGQLRDTTVETTWTRVAAALSSGERRTGYQRRLLDAFSSWQLLADERILATAGTGVTGWSADDLCAVLNAAAFVRAPGSRHPSFDTAAFEETTALAVHALDDAALLAGGRPAAPGGGHVRIGLIGLGDALALLGLHYDSDEGRLRAASIARNLAMGCLAGSIALARDREPRVSCDARWQHDATERGLPVELRAAAVRYGMRHESLTAITSQRRLACFANGVADALDPLTAYYCEYPQCGSGDRRGAQIDGFAALVARQSGLDVRRLSPRAENLVPAQLAMRAAIQPWIDERIIYPLCVERLPDAALALEWNRLAADLDLVPPSWRVAGAACKTPQPTAASTAATL